MEEKKKSSNTNTTLILFFFILAAFIGFWYWQSQKPTNREESPTTQEASQEEQIEEHSPMPEVAPDAVVERYSNSFFMASQPDPNQKAAEEALSLLSENAKQSIVHIEDKKTSLIFFTKTEGVPGEVELIVKSASQVGDKATVEVLWKYGFGQNSKVFNLVMEDNRWKIDFISR